MFSGSTAASALWDELRSGDDRSPFLGYGYLASRSIILDTAEWAAAAHNALLQIGARSRHRRQL